MTRAEQILREMENRRDFQLLEEQNGAKCAGKIFAAFARADRNIQADLDNKEIAKRRRAGQRASKPAHRGFERSRERAVSRSAATRETRAA